MGVLKLLQAALKDLGSMEECPDCGGFKYHHEQRCPDCKRK